MVNEPLANPRGSARRHAAQWKELLKKIQTTGKWVEIQWVKGHKESVHNKAADKLAKNSAKGVTRAPLTVTSVRRKITDKAVEAGSVKMLGQVLTFHIITDTYLRLQRIWKYKYEVMSEPSPFKGCVDFACSEVPLRAGHHYVVRFSDNPANPTIVECLEETKAPSPEDC